ncbi:hypothetical protein K1719_004695 [Acacia pycnantha]|nr:hypothetical protein K1719_004695 [Acacia pycnantha]
MAFVLIRSYYRNKKQRFNGVIQWRFLAFLVVVVVIVEFNGKRSKSYEAWGRERRVRERAFIEGEEQELEVGEPGDEEGEDGYKMNRMKVERKIEEETDDRQEQQESEEGSRRRNNLAYEKAVRQRCDDLKPCVALHFLSSKLKGRE